MIKNCPYFNYSLETQIPIIACKNSLDTRQVKFRTLNERDEWYNNSCNCNFTNCRYYKTFKANEIVEGKKNESSWSY